VEYRLSDGEFKNHRILLEVIGCDDGIREEILSSLLGLPYFNCNSLVSGADRLVYDPPNQEEGGKIRDGINKILTNYGLKPI
jgi:hypothetical protein